MTEVKEGIRVLIKNLLIKEWDILYDVTKRLKMTV